MRALATLATAVVAFATPAWALEPAASHANTTTTHGKAEHHNNFAVALAAFGERNGEYRAGIEAGGCFAGERKRWEIEACFLLSLDNHRSLGGTAALALYGRITPRFSLGGGALVTVDLPHWQPTLGGALTANATYAITHSGSVKLTFEAGGGLYGRLTGGSEEGPAFGPLGVLSMGVLVRLL